MEQELKKELRITMALEIAGSMDNRQLMNYVDELIEIERKSPTDRKQIAIIEKLFREPIEGLRKRIWVGAYEVELDKDNREIDPRRSLLSPESQAFLDEIDQLCDEPEANQEVMEIDTQTEEERLADDYFFAHLFDKENPPILGGTVFASQAIGRYSIENLNNKNETGTEPVDIFKIGFTMELFFGRNDNKSWLAFYEKVKTMENLADKEQEDIIHKLLSEPIEGIHKRICLGFSKEDPGNFDCKIYGPQILSYAQITGYNTMYIFIEGRPEQNENQEKENTGKGEPPVVKPRMNKLKKALQSQ